MPSKSSELTNALTILQESSRILVLGSPCSGKTSLARGLGECLGIRLIHLDDLYWGENWQRPPPERWRTLQEEAVCGSSWIIDGGYIDSLEIRLGRANLAIVLRQNAIRCLTRYLLRSLQISLGRRDLLPRAVRRRGASNAPGDLLKLSRKILAFDQNDLPRIRALADQLGTPIVECRGRHGVEALLAAARTLHAAETVAGSAAPSVARGDGR